MLTNIIIVTLLQNKLILADVEDTHNVAKRMDLESCIGKYVIFTYLLNFKTCFIYLLF